MRRNEAAGPGCGVLLDYSSCCFIMIWYGHVVCSFVRLTTLALGLNVAFVDMGRYV